MKPFVVIAVLLTSVGAYLVVAGAIQADACIDAGTFSLDIWTPEFWLLVPGDAARGPGVNARWFVRVAVGLLLVCIGWVVLRVAKIELR